MGLLIIGTDRFVDLGGNKTGKIHSCWWYQNDIWTRPIVAAVFKVDAGRNRANGSGLIKRAPVQGDPRTDTFDVQSICI